MNIHLLPTLIVHDIRHSGRTHPKHLGDSLLHHSGPCKTADAVSIFHRQAGVPVTCTSHASPLGHHIVMVVLVRAEKQVVRIHAGWNITSMEDQLSLGNSAIMKFPRYAMSKAHLIWASALTDLPISARIRACRPKPALFSLVYLRPKSFRNRFAVRSILVASHIPQMLTPDPSILEMVLTGYRRQLATATHAQTRWIGWGACKLQAHSMSFHRVPRTGLFKQRRCFAFPQLYQFGGGCV